MDQFEFEGHTLILKVRKGPFIVRTILFFLAFFSVLAPLTAITYAISTKAGLKLGYILSPILFGIMGFYMLRLALWNTFGREIIILKSNSLNYVADYGWFKDGKKDKTFTKSPVFSVERIGYEEDFKGRLLISFSEDDTIKCVTVMPIDQLQLIIQKLS